MHQYRPCFQYNNVLTLYSFFFLSPDLRWSFQKLASTRRLWTPCFTRSCRCRTTPCWRPRVEATPTAALTARKRKGPEALSSASASVESTSRDTARTTTGPWDTETTDRRGSLKVFHIHDEHSNMKITHFSSDLFHSYFLYHYLGLDVITSDFYSHNLWVIITWSRATASNCRFFLYY